MVAVRLRHPKGSATIDIPLDRDDYTVLNLQQDIYAATDILPSRQTLNAGYPPQPLTIIPELSVSSLGLKAGDQIIVNEIANTIRSGTAGHSSPSGHLETVAPRLQARSPQVQADSAPISSAPTPQKSGGLDFVETEGGMLIHRVVPDDNSCLFSAVALIFEQSITKAPDMRKMDAVVAEGIKNDPETYNEAILGMPPLKYITNILKPSTWGGAIELGILAAHYNTEISSLDVETGRIDRFSPPSGIASTRCIVLYSGIHYDAATIAPTPEAPDEWHQTLFPLKRSDEMDPVLIAAKKLGDILRRKKAFTNTTTFDLKCEECGLGLKGEKDARAHATATGHVRFGEY